MQWNRIRVPRVALEIKDQTVSIFEVSRVWNSWKKTKMGLVGKKSEVLSDYCLWLLLGTEIRACDVLSWRFWQMPCYISFLTGLVQVPYLKDPNSASGMFESSDIVNYIQVSESHHKSDLSVIVLS